MGEVMEKIDPHIYDQVPEDWWSSCFPICYHCPVCCDCYGLYQARPYQTISSQWVNFSQPYNGTASHPNVIFVVA